ncbi:MAG: hypothetical protein AUK20_03235 [Parcubacteria group bacterium CG2_30_45_37]|nr:MAG: hypothetical protein AUK20_03235 [Parcubacteria group bacterium CG2_30_45_37]
MIKKTIIIALIVLAAGFLFWNNLNSPVDQNGQEQIFVVSQGETVSQIAENLRTNNLISSVVYFKYEVWRSRLNLKAGEYAIGPKLSAREIIKILSQGQALSREKTIRIIEGWNLNDINNYLNKNKIVAMDSFLSLANRPVSQEWRSSYGLPDNADLEGFLFPDTYRIDKEATAADIIKKMLDNFQKKLTPAMAEEIKRQNKSVYEIITMASLIEKEVRTPEDMKIVSGIFWQRIENRQGLESCATLAYILGVNKPQYSVADTKIDSPYNTYKHRGLPPSPIANPGLNAITAAIYPKETDYNYFLSDPATGQTIFSRTLGEHNLNKAKYLK